VTPLASCFLEESLSMTRQPKLHLVDAEGAHVSPIIRDAVKAGVKVGQRGGAKVGQWMAMQLLSISWGRASGA
jgi:hypothetical protein